ncbi:MAG TPA: hypothetical protein VIT62_06580 [Lysobacter sp.]
MDQIDHLVQVAIEVSFLSDEWDRRVRAPVENFATKSSGALRGYAVAEVLADRGLYHVFQLQPHRVGFAKLLEPHATRTWQMIQGNIDRALAEDAIAFARAQFARCQLYESLRVLNAMATGYRHWSTLSFDSLRQLVIETDWTDADEVASSPFRQDYFGESACQLFDAWCSRFERKGGPSGAVESPHPDLEGEGLELHDVMAAITMVWIDAAAMQIGNPGRSMEMLGEAAGAMRESGVQLGWTMRSEAQRRADKDNSKLGWERRHGKAAKLKEWGVTQAKLMNGSAMEVAKHLAQNLPEEHSSASRDPERLLYEAILADQKAAKSPQSRRKRNTAKG